MTDDELEDRLSVALAPPAAAPPAERVAALRARAAQLGADRAPAAAQGHAPRGRLLLTLAAGVALLATGGALGAALAGGDEEADLLARGVPEFGAVLADDGVVVRVDGSRAPEGRIVLVSSETLPVLPSGDYYELWFVGPDDAPAAPDRVSAGTFHPADDDGSTSVVLHAAVDPALFPAVEITAETADGDPTASDDVVLRGALGPSGSR